MSNYFYINQSPGIIKFIELNAYYFFNYWYNLDMQLPPHPHLAYLVKHYLILDGLPAANGMHRLFADGNTGLVFNLGHAALCAESAQPSVHPCWLYGQVKTYHDLLLTGSINWIVVVLKPYGAYHLWGAPGTEWYN